MNAGLSTVDSNIGPSTPKESRSPTDRNMDPSTNLPKEPTECNMNINPGTETWEWALPIDFWDRKGIFPIQLSIQLCLVNLKPGVIVDVEADNVWTQWESWPKFQHSERELLGLQYPENLLEPPLPDGKTPDGRIWEGRNKADLDMQSERIVLVRNRKLCLFRLQWAGKSYAGPVVMPKPTKEAQPNSMFWEVKLYCSEERGGRW
ncbi:MAG: hypothetical protein M1839_006709 [Geoglossum umbratile]|nr:MAG: hypothetical protein M1839_006709 [Geoglossum umbratile]